MAQPGAHRPLIAPPEAIVSAKTVFVQNPSGRIPEAKVHLYGKAERAGRKVGHVNVVGRDDRVLVLSQGYFGDRMAEHAGHFLLRRDGWT